MDRAFRVPRRFRRADARDSARRLTKARGGSEMFHWVIPASVCRDRDVFGALFVPRHPGDL